MSDDVLISAERGVGRIRLNRPKAIHALTTEMCEVMSEALLRWRTDSNIQCILIDHAEGRGFCAGGDVVMLAKSGAGDAHKAKEFFFAEYRLNHLLFSYEKPTIAIMDGITMGGGVGISQPCTFKVATENTRLAMPETGIGLFPDVGGGWYLSRLPGRAGQFMALTGARLDGAECTYLGLATHYIPTASLEELVDRIVTAPDRAQGTLTFQDSGANHGTFDVTLAYFANGKVRELAKRRIQLAANQRAVVHYGSIQPGQKTIPITIS